VHYIYGLCTHLFGTTATQCTYFCRVCCVRCVYIAETHKRRKSKQVSVYVCRSKSNSRPNSSPQQNRCVFRDRRNSARGNQWRDRLFRRRGTAQRMIDRQTRVSSWNVPRRDLRLSKSSAAGGIVITGVKTIEHRPSLRAGNSSFL